MSARLQAVSEKLQDGYPDAEAGVGGTAHDGGQNIGYLKLNAFASQSLCSGAAVSVMQHLNGADTLIVDLRDNHGGEAAMVMKLAADLF